MNRTVALLALALLVLPALASVTQAGSIIKTGSSQYIYLENFSGFNPGATPTDSWYSVKTTGTMVHQVVWEKPGMAQAWQIEDTTAGAVAMEASNNGMSLCLGGSSQVAVTFSLTGNLDATAIWGIRFQQDGVSAAATVANSIGIYVNGQPGEETITAFVVGNDGTATTASIPHTVAVGEVFVLGITSVNCSGNAGATIRVTECGIPPNNNELAPGFPQWCTNAGGGLTETVTITDNSAFITGAHLRRLNIDSHGTLQSTPHMLIDRAAWLYMNYGSNAFEVTGVSPSKVVAGFTGQTLYVYGSGFAASDVVKINGVDVTETFVSASEITVSPAWAQSCVPGNSYTVTVTKTDGTVATAPNTVECQQTLWLNSVDPNKGPTTGGQTVTLHGSGFEAGMTVKFDNAPLTNIQVISSTKATGVTSSHPVGAVSMFTLTRPSQYGSTSTSSPSYTYQAPSDGDGTAGLTINSVSPAQGTKGTSVRITLNKQDVIEPKFFFGTQQATVVNAVNGAGGTKIYTVTAPANAPGYYTVSVTSTNYATASLANGFLYVEPKYACHPQSPPDCTPPCANYRPLNKEFFEDSTYDPGDVPTRCWYKFLPTGSSSFVTSDTYYPATSLKAGNVVVPYFDGSGNQSVKMATTGATGNQRYQLLSGFNFCEGDVTRGVTARYGFAYRSTKDARIGYSDIVTGDDPFTATATATWGYIELKPGVSATLGVRSTTATTTTNFLTSAGTPFVPASDKWYVFGVGIQCRDIYYVDGNPVHQMCVQVYDETGLFIGTTCSAVTPPGVVTAQVVNFYVDPLVADYTGYLDDLNFGYEVSPDKHYKAPTGFGWVGMDVDPLGGVVVLRSTEDRSTIYTANGELEALANDKNTDHDSQTSGVQDESCQNGATMQRHGVMAWSSAVIAFVVCVSSSHREIVIRHPANMNIVYQREYEIGELGDEGGSGSDEEVPDDTLEIYRMARLPLDYTNCADTEKDGFETDWGIAPGKGPCHGTTLGFAFSEKGTGRVGVYVETQHDNADDEARVTKTGEGTVKAFAPDGQTVTQMCVVSVYAETASMPSAEKKLFYNKRLDYLVAAHPGVGVGMWRIGITYTEHGDPKNPTLTPVPITNPDLLKASAVDCATQYIAVGVNEAGKAKGCVLKAQTTTGGGAAGKTIWCEQLGNTVVRSAAINLNGVMDAKQNAEGTGGHWAAFGYAYGANNCGLNFMVRGVEHEDIKFGAPVAKNCNYSSLLTARMDTQANYLYVMLPDRVQRIPLKEITQRGLYYPDPDPTDPGGSGDSDVDPTGKVCSYPDGSPAPDGIEDQDDPNPANYDANNNGICDGYEDEVCPTVGGPCYPAKDLAKKCKGQNTPECQKLKEDLEKKAQEGDKNEPGTGCPGCKPIFPGMDVAVLAADMGMPTSAFAAMLCIFLILALGVGLAQFNSGAGYTGAAAAAILCVFLELIPLWVPVVLFACAIAWILYRRSSVGS